MKDPPRRTTADLSDYPDLVVIYLGMRVEEPRGEETLERLGPQIRASVEAEPDGLLLHEEVAFPNEGAPHYGMRQYWRDFDSLEAWAARSRTSPGGRTTSATAAARRSGMRRTSAKAGSSQSSLTWATARSG